MNPILTARLLAILSLPMIFGCGSDGPADETAPDEPEAARPPNLVIFYVDDLGYGDVGSYGAVGVETPSIDRLAAEGIRFTDAHSTAATCTPSRYSLQHRGERRLAWADDRLRIAG